MNKFMRMLMMFGPILFRQFQKYQRNKARQQPTQNTNRQANREQQTGEQHNNERGEHS